MLERLQTLIEFSRLGKVNLVADSLRVSQPTVSKRLSQLEHDLGLKLFERKGRELSLTPEALSVIEKAQPLLAEISELSETLSPPDKRHRLLTIGVSDSVLGSWGATSFAQIQKDHPNLKLSLHAHRGPRVVSMVASGTYQLGLVAGRVNTSASGLIELALGSEPMVLVGSQSSKGLITSEDSSLTWKEIGAKVLSHGYHVEQRLESFFAVAQMAKANMGIGLVPNGVANSLRISRQQIQSFRPKIYRSVKLIGRKSFLSDPQISNWTKSFGKIIKKQMLGA